MGVALWLCPKTNTPVYDKLTTVMSSLNTLFPGQPPKFEPHITITTNISIDLDDKAKTKDDVDKILSASAVAMSSLPKNHESLVKVGKVNSQRKFFKKLYFEVEKDPNLVSFARIIRELFVIVPQDIEKENMKHNPHLYTTDSHGNTVKRRPSRRKSGTPPKVEEFDTTEIQRAATYKAAEWSIDEYDPHISLVYSDLWPIHSALWRNINSRVSDIDWDVDWEFNVLKLVLCEGDVNDWIVLGSVDIH
ncbi:CPD1 2' [Candida maltosa Xu316]